MYHSVYPTSWLLGNHSSSPKSPLFMTYSDLPIIALDPVTAFASYGQLQSLYSSQIVFDVTNMKKIPLNLLMRNMESLNCYVPMWQRKDFSAWPFRERRYSRDSGLDSSNYSDSGISSSRSSTPNSIEVGVNSELKALTQGESSGPSIKRIRKLSESACNSYGQMNKQKNTPAHQRRSTFSGKRNFQFVFPENKWDKVSQDIWSHYLKNRQPDEMFHKKMRLHNAVFSVLSQVFPKCCLRVVGSSVNGLGANTSDMDMCLIVTPTEIDHQNEVMFLTVAQNWLRKCNFIKSSELITAKVPILKFTDKYDIQVDLNVNNTVGIANTNLIRNYCYLDWRVQPLVLIIKKWAQDCDINNAKDMTLSSYSLTLMVLHYLQCGCHPPVLPCLQKMRPDPHDDLPLYKSKNLESLGELLIGFFDYFTNRFDFDKDVMSIRLGCKLPKHVAMNYRSARNKRGHWRYICIEEPFNRTNTACAVYDKEPFAKIFTAFRTTWLNLRKNKDISSVLKL